MCQARIQSKESCSCECARECPTKLAFANQYQHRFGRRVRTTAWNRQGPGSANNRTSRTVWAVSQTRTLDRCARYQRQTFSHPAGCDHRRMKDLSQLRTAAREIFDEALRGVNPEDAVRRAI